MANGLLLNFQDDDTPLGITRTTLERLAKELGLNETATVHYALSRLARERLPAYEKDDGALTASDLEWLNETASTCMPGGARIVRKSLL